MISAYVEGSGGPRTGSGVPQPAASAEGWTVGEENWQRCRYTRDQFVTWYGDEGERYLQEVESLLEGGSNLESPAASSSGGEHPAEQTRRNQRR